MKKDLSTQTEIKYGVYVSKSGRLKYLYNEHGKKLGAE